MRVCADIATAADPKQPCAQDQCILPGWEKYRRLEWRVIPYQSHFEIIIGLFMSATLQTQPVL